MFHVLRQTAPPRNNFKESKHEYVCSHDSQCDCPVGSFRLCVQFHKVYIHYVVKLGVYYDYYYLFHVLLKSTDSGHSENRMVQCGGGGGGRGGRGSGGMYAASQTTLLRACDWPIKQGLQFVVLLCVLCFQGQPFIFSFYFTAAGVKCRTVLHSADYIFISFGII